MEWVPGKKIYFLSDFHLGAPNQAQSHLREKRLVRFLQNAKKRRFSYIYCRRYF